MSSNKETVCAVVVTYNRKELLIECLEALQKQTRPLQAIYLIDNASTDKTPELLLEKGYIQELPPKELNEPWEKEFEIKNLTNGDIIKVHYVRMNENTGGAGGFHEGVKRAYEKEYDWLWLMDDDGKPFNNETLIKLRNFHKISGLLVLQPLVVSKENTKDLAFKILFDKKEFYSIEDLNNDIYYNYITLFNGTLINRKVIATIGFPNKRLFIWGDEVEYFYRIKNKFKTCIYTKSLFIHPKSRMKSKRFLNQNFIYKNNNLKDYCFYRNRTFLYLKVNKFKLFMFFIKYNLYFLFTFKFDAFFLFNKAVCHGVFNIWGKEKNCFL
ncbi:glycosyltransferase family 2 protein [Lebetimonas sp. JH369]|uniref:glycosyltransferase family 2 protein n=1 Tax=Lebetimonas sp. JH369 TaxID=990069 RepID=UPI0004633C41|nr:glycosyltransferase family 2 protein [Lebetimonas sp. JH369]